MARKHDKNILAALDIGTSKIVALIGEIASDGTIEVIGIGRAPSNGLKRGVVVNIEATIHSIQRAVHEAELMAGCEVHSVFTGIAGSHIKSVNSHGIVAIKDREVSQLDIDRVIDAAKAIVIPSDQKILHILPQEFIIDNQGMIKEPAGMAGVRLESKVHIVTGAVSAAQNITKCVKRCGLEVSDIVLEQLASSHAVLSEDEKELGICMIDIGGGTTDLAIFSEGAIQHTAVIPIAGDQVTNDIAVALRTSSKTAESIKLEHACALTDLVNANQMIEVAGVHEKMNRKIALKTLSEVVYARYEELMMLAHNEILRSGFSDKINAGIVLTGGASNVKGLAELAEYCFKMPVRIGWPQDMRGLQEVNTNGSYATGVGLLLHGYKQLHESKYQMSAMPTDANGIWNKMKHWFQGHF